MSDDYWPPSAQQEIHRLRSQLTEARAALRLIANATQSDHATANWMRTVAQDSLRDGGGQRT